MDKNEFVAAVAAKKEEVEAKKAEKKAEREIKKAERKEKFDEKGGWKGVGKKALVGVVVAASFVLGETVGEKRSAKNLSSTSQSGSSDCGSSTEGN